MCSVSVIIPVFNAEATLEDCISSLNGQTLQSIEFIFVNDGSTDASSDILDSWMLRNPKIHVVHQENQGVSVARNVGIQHAKGQYIGFVDADDRVLPDYFETLYHLSQEYQVDCVVTRFHSTQNGKYYESKHPFPCNTGFQYSKIQEEVLPYFIEKDDLNPVWNKLFKKTVIDAHLDIHFPPRMVFGEDGIFTMLFLKHAQSLVFDSYCGYQYVEVQESATRNILNKDFLAIAKQQLEFDFEQLLNNSLSKIQIRKRQEQRFAQAVIAMIHLYLNAPVSKNVKRKHVEWVLNDRVVQDVFEKISDDWFRKLTRFERAICKGIQLKSVLLLTILTKYSNYRNQ